MEYFEAVGKKVLETLLSVKVWTIAAIIVVSTIMVYDDRLSGSTWASINGSVIATVFALREGFKIKRVNAKIEKGEEISKKDLIA